MSARRAGDRGWLLETKAPLRVAAALRSAFALEEVVPGDATVLVVGDIPLDDLLAVDATGEASVPAQTVEIPVIYDGTDLAEVAELTGLTAGEVIELHAGAIYTAAFLGFMPGWAYLTGLDERLVVPRRPNPRERVSGGTVAIAGPYSGVYPRDSPGGWRLLGRTDVVLFDPSRTQPALIEAGDLVRFVPQ
jgi:KipI family sensor histidine kinase inhibitor